VVRVQVVAAARAFVVLTVLGGLLFPIATTGVAQLLFPHEADGSLIERGGVAVGSELIGQAFEGSGYFHPRPSAAGPLAVGTNAAAVSDDLSRVVSGASNLGPSNPALVDAVADRASDYRATNGLDPGTPVPVDAVTSSASGLDPHISIANARLQARRVAEARRMALDEVLALVDDHTTGRALAVFGEPGVNVLALNLALNERAGR
jgi:K+-transporting ATPase ATPase C chain